MNRKVIAGGLIIAWFLTGAFGTPPPPAPRGLNVRAGSHDVTINNDCPGFPMEVDAFAEVMLHRQYDSTGKLVKTLITTPQGRMTFTNLTTGKSVWTPTSGVYESKTNLDGSQTFGWKGVRARIVVPGQGLVLADLGQVVWTLKFDSNGTLQSFKLSRSGIQDGVVPARLCDVLD